MTDQDLLREYAATASESAFRQLVQNHLALVYGAARRLVGESHSAEDVVQEVFTLLARKAGHLGSEVVVAGWLYRTTRHVSHEWLRREQRRTRREKLAMETIQLGPDDDWRAIKPVLETAMASLNQVDHDAVVLRYFQNQSLRQVGATLGLSEDAAQKRLSRAIDKLRRFFGRHGKSMTASSLVAALVSGAIESPPAGLAAVVSSTAVSSAAAAGLGIGLLNTITTMKLPIAVAAATAAILSMPLVVQQRNLNRLQEENRALQGQAALAVPAQAGAESVSNADVDELQQLRKEHAELMRLRGEVGSLRRQLATTKVSLPNAGSAALIQAGNSAESQAKKLAEETINVMKNLGLAARIYSTDHGNQFPTNFTQITQELPPVLPGNLPLDAFEFMPQPRTISEREPELLLFRERVPRQLPDGQWARAYTLADGSAVEQVTSDGNFDAFERAHIASGPPPAAPTANTPRMDEALMKRYGLKVSGQ